MTQRERDVLVCNYDLRVCSCIIASSTMSTERAITYVRTSHFLAHAGVSKDFALFFLPLLFPQRTPSIVPVAGSHTRAQRWPPGHSLGQLCAPPPRDAPRRSASAARRAECALPRHNKQILTRCCLFTITAPPEASSPFPRGRRRRRVLPRRPGGRAWSG